MLKTKLNREKIMSFLEENKAILKKYHVKRIGLFGSFFEGKQKKTSDVDFLVEFEKPSFDNFMDLTEYFEDKLKRKVDLITKGNLSPYISPYIKNKVLWYES